METKTIVTTAAILAVIGGVLYGSRIWSQNVKKSEAQKLEASGDLISMEGIHWHPELTITIKGERQVVPTNIGVGMEYAGYPQYDPMMMMTNTHTHDASGMIHWEVKEGPVTKDDVRLAQFFAVWGKTFTSSCIFDYCSGPDGTLSFKVNGQDNQDFENYLVKDKDKIEIIFN